MTKSVIAELSAIPEKFLENDLKPPQPHSQGCLYPYLETKKLLDGSNVFYPRVIGERDPNNPFCWRWAFNWKEKHNGVWKGKSIGSIPPGAVPMIRTLQQQGATREDIIAFIKRAKSKKPSSKLDVCKNFDNTKIKPVLPDDAPIAIVLFAGGGGIEAGMVQAGIRPVIAVEFDPSKPDLSRAIAKTHHHNFSEYGCRIIQLTVQEVAQSGFIGFPRRPDYLHASPVCANFSQAHTAKAGKGIETADDLTAAIAIAEAIRQLQPRVFTLENVPRYQNSQSFAIILDALELEGYSVTYSVVNMADFGLPQARRRLVLVACQDLAISLPPTSNPIGWHEAIAHLIPSMTDSQLLPKQQQALEKFLAGNAPTPLLIERVGGRIQSKYKPGHLPCNTILRSYFTDHKGCNRSKFADIWLPDGKVKSLSIEGAAKLQGFPDWYEFPSEAATAGSIIGYSVPPSFATQLFMSAQSILQGAIA
ncbi:DNA cytosine methyltransferase [Nostoc sp. 'Peltigera membranacea cyanobiont' N6]|uniref:DNA cytosine methyltransferase n=1 Tax=Nostoc sp. 'Peltigera membranacea cyanobiont' N6 TaxID=1261031 RepID=UPI000CF314AC|nr:DNA cytosine methyltransferase [Nostoc sp. 'Peltigera membranacea cyanobiont' N6]AVH66269.1 cytosine-specific DNA methyltransferase [Nostoc sp. 'Peltigera membranacea cyanobiont' N6]